MRNFHIKSILLGIGIGIVITSVISMIYAAGINTDKSLSRDEIVLKARELGMVDGTSILNNQQKDVETDNNNSDEKIDTSSNKEKSGSENTNLESNKTDDMIEKPDETKKITEISISVNPGDTSEVVASRLLKLGLIKDKKSFIEKLTELGLASEINVGEFNIKEGSNVVEIIRIITGTK